VERTSVMELGDWLLTLLLLLIPIVNIVLLIYWSVSGGTNLNKQNYARASLVFLVIGVALSFMFGGLDVFTRMAF
jgi:hypothetical protein